jgi:N-acetylneuraminic acid mutarotase
MPMPHLSWRLVLATGVALLALAPAHAAAAPATWTGIAWNTTFAQPHAASEAQGLALGGKLYSFGGFDSTKACCTPTSRAFRMDPATGWTPLAPMPPENGTSFGGISHAGLATDGTYIYWAGGYTSNAAGTAQTYGTKEVWRYDPTTDSYLRMLDLPLTRAAGQLAYLDGKLHYFGGTNLARTLDVGEHWELDLSNVGAGWVARAPLPNPRHHMGAAVLGGRIYAIGGQHKHDAQLTTQKDVNAYDPATDTWTRRADLPRAVGHIAAATFVMDGRILVLGGEIAHNSPIADANAYDPDANTWTALTKLPASRRSGVADTIGGAIYYSTGQSSTTFKGIPATPASAASKRFNYQPASAPVPAGYSVDSGLPFDAARGFGWVREDSLGAATHTPLDVSANTRDRNLVADQRLDTLLHMQLPAGTASGVTTPAAWECALPTGTYDVTVSVGDAAASLDSKHRINLEGQQALGPFVPTSANHFASATKTVAVSDGRLTVDARGGTNTKIDYVEIVPSAAPPGTAGPEAPSQAGAPDVTTGSAAPADPVVGPAITVGNLTLPALLRHVDAAVVGVLARRLVTGDSRLRRQHARLRTAARRLALRGHRHNTRRPVRRR